MTASEHASQKALVTAALALSDSKTIRHGTYAVRKPRVEWSVAERERIFALLKAFDAKQEPKA